MVPGHPRPGARPVLVQGCQFAGGRRSRRALVHVCTEPRTRGVRRHPADQLSHQLPGRDLLVHCRRGNCRRSTRYRPDLWHRHRSGIRRRRSGRRRPGQLCPCTHPCRCTNSRYLHRHPPLRCRSVRCSCGRHAGDQHDPRHRDWWKAKLHRGTQRRCRPVPARCRWSLHRDQPAIRCQRALHRRSEPGRSGHRQPVQHQLRTHRRAQWPGSAYHAVQHLRQIVDGGAADPDDRPAQHLLAQSR
ncbi:hypothetical protein D3C84_747720 [compost metagenome]